MRARRPRSLRATVVSLGLVALSALACGGPAGPTLAPASATPPAAQPTPAPPTPRPSGPVEPCAKNDGQFCDLEPGPYRSTAFEGGVAFSLADTWTNTDNASDLVAMFRDAPTGTEWLQFVGGPVREGLETPPDASAEGLAARLATIGGLAVETGAAREVDGHDATVIDVANAGSGTVVLFLYAVTEGQYYLDPGVTVQILWLDIDDRIVLVTLEAPTAAFGAFEEAVAEPFLASIDLGG